MGFGSLIQRITYKVSGRTSSSSGLFVPSTYTYDYALGGQPLVSATTDQRPDTEKLADQKKQQFENYKDPGEYSLTQWWLRSQSSYVGGTGIIYQDPDTQGQPRNIRFAHSIGVDPFTYVNNLALLKECNPTTLLNGTGSGVAYCKGISSSVFGDIVFAAQGVNWYVQTVGISDLPSTAANNMAPSASASSTLTGGMVTLADAAQQIAHAYVFLLDPTGGQSGVYRLDKPATGALTATRIYVANSTTTPPGVTLGASRGSVFLGLENALYVLNPYAGANTVLPTVSAQVPQGQVIVSITDGPDATYVGANGFNQGYIYKTTVDPTSGAVNGLQLTAVLPQGELINDAQAYLNSYMVLATTTGIRVGTFTPGFSGAIFQYGPKLLTVPRSGTGSGPEGGVGFGRISFYGSRAYICTLGPAQHDGFYGLMAVDLATIVTDNNTGANFQAYCTWDYVPNTATQIIDVTVTSTGRAIFTYSSGASAVIALEHRDNYISSGYMDTGRCRFNTIEPKLFKYLSVRTPTPLQGNLTVSLLDDTGGITNYITYGPTLTPGTSDISTATPQGPHLWEAFRFTLNRGATDPTVGARLESWQIKALPGVLKQRQITRNFLCFNTMKDRSGQFISGDSQALSILNNIRQMAQRGDVITLQDLVNNTSDQVVIDDYQFSMMAPPGPNKENYGGYLTITMRTVADAVPPPPSIPPEPD